MTEDSAVNPLQLKFIQMVCRLVLQLGIDSTTLHFCSYAGAYVALSVDQAIHSASHKSLQYLEYQVGAKLWLPVFCSAQGLDVQWEPYVILSTIVHTGTRLNSGHFQSILSGYRRHPTAPGWVEQITDDNKSARACTELQQQHAKCNCYLFGLHKL